MNKQEYNNVIETTIAQQSGEKDSLQTTREVLNNMGVVLPQGDLKQVSEGLATEDYMGWRKCSVKEAQEYANEGTAVVAVSKDKIALVAANDDDGEGEVAVNSAAVMTLSENTSALAVVDTVFYANRAVATDLVVGVLTIFSSNDGSETSSSEVNTSGHAFLSFKNTSYSSIMIGGYSVGATEEVTIGTWGNKDEHEGIWYNLESYFIHQLNAYSNRVSLSMAIKTSQINTINLLMEDNNEWSYLTNCSSFAAEVWNSVSSVDLTSGWIDTPTTLMESIEERSGYQTERLVQYNPNIGYLDNGIFVPVTRYAQLSSVQNVMSSTLEFIVPISMNPNSFPVLE